MTFARPDVTVLVGVVLMGLATVLQIIGIATPGWGRIWVGELGETLVGLWEYCYELPNFTCENIENLWHQTGWLEVTRCFGVLAILTQMACMMTVLLLCCVKQLPIFFVVTAWTALTTALLIFVEISIYIGVVERKQNSLGRDFHYNYAFILTVLSLFFCLVAAALFFIGEARLRKNETVSVRLEN